MTDELSRISDRKVPLPLAELKNKKVRFFNVCESDNMEETVLKMLSKKG